MLMMQIGMKIVRGNNIISIILIIRFYAEAFAKQIILVVSVSNLSVVPERYLKHEYFGKIITLQPPTKQERKEMLV